MTVCGSYFVTNLPILPSSLGFLKRNHGRVAFKPSVCYPPPPKRDLPTSIGKLQTTEGKEGYSPPWEESEWRPKYKVVFIGNAGSGKTALIRQITEGVFSAEESTPTIIDFRCWKRTKQDIMLWDTAGEGRRITFHTCNS